MNMSTILTIIYLPISIYISQKQPKYFENYINYSNDKK